MSPALLGRLTRSLSCPSAVACTAVGTAGPTRGRASTVAERWDGQRWRLDRTRNPASSNLNAVSCPVTTWCIAVGGVSPRRARRAVEWQPMAPPRSANPKRGGEPRRSRLPFPAALHRNRLLHNRVWRGITVCRAAEWRLADPAPQLGAVPRRGVDVAVPSWASRRLHRRRQSTSTFWSRSNQLPTKRHSRQF
jgi:hypothetical protein